MGQPTGFRITGVILDANDDPIEGVRVDDAYRSRQVGRRLFEWAITEARRHGCHMVQLTADKTRPDAHRFYESLGFTASHLGMKLHLPRGA